MTYYPKFFLNKGRMLALWVMYTTLKNSFKFQLLAIWRKQTPFVDQKCTHETWAGPSPPPDLDKIQKNSSFFCVTPSLTWAQRQLGHIVRVGLRGRVPGSHIESVRGSWVAPPPICLAQTTTCRPPPLLTLTMIIVVMMMSPCILGKRGINMLL